MARIYGTIESLNSLKSELEHHGISRFNSVKEIKEFLSNYSSEKHSIIKNVSNQLENEYFEACANLRQREQQKTEKLKLEAEKINYQIVDIQSKFNCSSTENTNFLKKLLLNLNLYFLGRKLNYLVRNKVDILNLSVKDISKEIERDEFFIKKYESEKHSLIEKRVKS